MQVKALITIVLLAFVAVSVVYLIVKETRPPSAPAMASNSAQDTAPAQAPALIVDQAALAETAADKAATNTADDTPVPAHQVQAFYFHTNTRCPSCIKIEKYSSKAIKEGFTKELNSGALVFRVVNTDEKGNAHYVKDYDIVTKSLILVDMHQGKQTRWINLEQVWDLLGDEAKFVQYVHDNVTEYLNEEE